MANWNEIGKNLVKVGIFEGFPDLQEGIFERFPELIPAVGEPNYWNGEHKKLLLVGESNYFEDKYESISDFKKPKDWYLGGKDRLIPKEKNNDVNNWKGSRGHNNIFKSMKAVLDEAGIKSNKVLLQEAAYYNYFLRPASVTKANKGFQKNCELIDRQVSYLALRGIIDEIKPNIVIFVSMFSHDTFMEYYKQEENHYELVDIHYVNHFSQACWSDPNGQQKFEDLLREHWVNKNPKNEIVFNKLKAIHNLLINKFKEVIYKPSNCIVWDGHYISYLYLKVNDKTFCCETNVTINDVNFWTGFYETDKCEKIPALDGKEYNFKPNFNNDIVVDSIEKLINQIIEEISKTS